MQQNYNNYLLLEILKLSTKFHIIPQTHKKNKCGNGSGTDRRIDERTGAEES